LLAEFRMRLKGGHAGKQRQAGQQADGHCE
jgi:hypothetical protein